MLKTLLFITLIISTSYASQLSEPVSSKNINEMWSSKLINARGKTVNFALWGGSENINKWIDGFVTKTLKKKFNITLNRIPLKDTQVAIQKLLKEKKLKKKKGSIDLVWVNGENFKTMKEKGLTWKPYLKMLPNSKYIDLKDTSISNDFGFNHKGHESPWGSAQMVFIYNSKKIPNPPKSIKQLKAWILRNPGRFTYSSPPDFTGSAFVRQTFMNLISKKDYQKLSQDFNKELFDKKSKPLWTFLNDIKPFLYKKGNYYPESVSKLHTLYSDEKIWLTMDYYPTTAQRMINKGVFPKSTKTFILKEGSLSNTHFVSIPFNASQKSAAMILANFLLSPEAQISKLDPKNWGDFTVLNTSMVPKVDRKKLGSIDLGAATLPISELSSNKTGELPAPYVPHIEKEWKKNILK